MLLRHGLTSNIYLNDYLTFIQQGRDTFEFHHNLLVAQHPLPPSHQRPPCL
ncbi:hypothetical protein [Lactiplantibacillus plantarum]|uniref:hypothetical protein n=1 Tax=Lactiplantibacillus plantarum TaxID=1590 RepID=UPI001F202D6F|nr:hypothetical protein [Lactiplantibacillus plantarum]